MCGRFTQAYTWQKLVALYRLTVPALAALEGIAERRLVGHGLGAGVEGRRHFLGGLFSPGRDEAPNASGRRDVVTRLQFDRGHSQPIERDQFSPRVADPFQYCYLSRYDPLK